MMKSTRWPLLGLVWASAVGVTGWSAEPPPFEEVYRLVRSNLVGVSEAELDRAATEGFVSQLRPRVTLAGDAASEAPVEPTAANLAVERVFDRTLAYLRVESIERGSADAFPAALAGLTARHPIEGLVLDLRFARGGDYAAAGRVADTFVAKARPLLAWGNETANSSPKTNAFDRPVIVLINRETRGAAEALAAALRHADVGLLLGSTTAGQASLYKEFPLSTGQRLRVASTPVRVGNDEEIPSSGVKPDIEVTVRPDDERLFLADPYRPPSRPGPGARRGPGDGLGAATNRPARITEADLVRMKRDGLDLDEGNLAPARATSSSVSVVTDPALARALDLLKGLNALKPRR